MSRTEKDRPWWVQVSDLARVIEHDHTDGRCVISDDRRQRWGAFQHHRWRNCKHRVVVHFECTKAEPYVAPNRYRGWMDAGRTCWTTVCGCPVPDAWKREDSHAWGRCSRERVQCIGHTRVEWDYSIPCECDDWDPPTCFPRAPEDSGFNRYVRGGVPSDYVRVMYHKPERARVRAGLHDAASRFNAGADLEDWDLPNYQARNSCRWLYW
jgi:hypothetical protein